MTTFQADQQGFIDSPVGESWVSREQSVSFPAERAEALHALLLWRVRLWADLDAAGDAAQRLHAAGRDAGVAELPLSASTWTIPGDAMVEVETQAAEGRRLVELIAQLRKDVRYDQQSLKAVKGVFKAKKIAALTDDVHKSKRDLEAARLALSLCEQQGLIAAAEVRRSLHRQLDESKTALGHIEQFGAPESQMPWELARWKSWSASGEVAADELRIGTLREGVSWDILDAPLMVPFIGGGRPIVLASQREDEYRQAAALMQSLVIRTMTMFPQQARYTLLDPAGNGLAFPMARNVPRVSVGTGDVRRDLDEVTREIQRIVRTYLDPSRPSFEDIPDEMRSAEHYHFVFAADFPNGYDLRAIEALETIARTGTKAGVYVIAHVNKDRERQALGGIHRYGLEEAVVVDMADTQVQFGDVGGTLVFDEAPSASLQDAIFTRLKAVPPRDLPIAWDDLNDLPESEWWQDTSEQLISAPIGRHGASELLNVWFGTDQWQQRPCVHGFLGAMPGAGKSTLFHNLITALAVRYSPDELRFHLIDGKFGVEFQPYARLPHASVVSLRTSPAMSRSVLADVVAEMSRRNAVFARAGVVDLPSYRRRGQPEGNMARLLLVVDEYQQLFDGDRDGEASANLLRLSQQGRSAGIHMLLASQRFDTAGMLHRADIFGNMHLRIAMQLAQADAATLTDFGFKGRRMIAATCDQVGRLVMNERAGDDEVNVSGKAALLDVDRRDEIIRALADKAMVWSQGSFRAPTIVFHGQAQPELTDNPHLQELLMAGAWPDAQAMEALARGAVDRRGLGVSDWLAAERPLAFFLGQEFNVRGHASVVVRRRATEHLLIVGEQHEARQAMVAASLLSAALIEAPGGLRVWVNDRSVERTPWSDALATTVESLSSLGYDASFGRLGSDLEELLRQAAAELRRREALSEAALADEPSILLVMTQPDRVVALQRVPDALGRTESELGTCLRQVLGLGSSLGIHVIMAATSLAVLRSVLTDKVIQTEIRHRVVLQMPEDDSFVLVRSAQASRLQSDGPRPIAALAFDSHQQSAVKFKPYCLASGDETGTRQPGTDLAGTDLIGQIVGIARQLGGRLG
jgi:DNA segregation ATPase FtsK/SpoIIIE, S-DNA-T family